jgi:hypothetical protein
VTAIPLFDQFLYRALHKVARDEIGTTSRVGVLQHRTADLTPRLVSALFTLYRDGFVALTSVPARDGWYAAELTGAGDLLLHEWANRLAAAHLTESAKPVNAPVQAG